MNASDSRHFTSSILIARRISTSCRRIMRTGSAHLFGLFSVVVAALIRPGPVVRWLSRRFPDVLFEQANAGPLIALSFEASPPSMLTPRSLDLLAEHDAHATFFMI